MGDICDEFTVGCCPYDEFFVKSVTKECTRLHDKARQSDYQSSRDTHPFEPSVLRTYEGIIRNVDRKILQNERCLSGANEQPDIFAALDYTEQLICQRELGDSDQPELYALLKIHGKLLERAQANDKPPKYSVCRNCSAFVEKEPCQHGFCRSYAKIRGLIKGLNSKLKMSQR